MERFKGPKWGRGVGGRYRWGAMLMGKAAWRVREVKGKGEIGDGTCV